MFLQKLPAFRKLPTLALTIGLAASALSACASDSGNQVEFWTMGLKPQFTGYMEETIAAFEKANPGMDVDWVDLPASAIEQKALSSVAGGNPPDLINLNPAFSSKLARQGALVELGAAIPADVLSQYYPASLDATRIDGKLFGLPWYLSTQVSVINKGNLDSAGVTAIPQTFRELTTHAAALQKAGFQPFLPSFGDGNKLLELMSMDGVSLLSADGKKAAFDTPEGRASFAYWVGLYKDGAIAKESLSLDHREVVDRFQAGQTTVLPAGPQFLTLIKQNAPELYAKLEVGPQLAGTSGKVGVGVMNLVVPKGAKHQEQAIALAQFITNAENQLAFSKLVPILPSVKAAAQAEYFTKLPANPTLEDRARQIAAEQLERAELLVPPLPRHDELAKALNQAFQSAALGKESPDAALTKAAADWERILSK
ncbi:Cyclodextrin-binding protein precursor [compost metagenome]